MFCFLLVLLYAVMIYYGFLHLKNGGLKIMYEFTVFMHVLNHTIYCLSTYKYVQFHLQQKLL